MPWLQSQAAGLSSRSSGVRGREDNPTVTADTTGFFFERDDHIWTTTGKTAPFAAVAPLPGRINESVLAVQPYVLPTGGALYFMRVNGGSSRQIYRAPKGTSAYAEVQPILGLGDGTEDDEYPVVTPDELTIDWSSQRGSIPTADIWVAKRTDRSAPFAGARRVAELNTTARDESPSFVSADGCRLYFTSRLRAAATMSTGDVLVASKPK